jgi:hypothetical protein
LRVEAGVGLVVALVAAVAGLEVFLNIVGNMIR